MLGFISVGDVLIQVRSTYELTIEALQKENRLLLLELAEARDERTRLLNLLERALHLEPRLAQQEKAPHEVQQVAGRNWRKVQSELEKRHRRPENATPEDVAAEYWAKKNSEMEKEAFEQQT